MGVNKYTWGREKSFSPFCIGCRRYFRFSTAEILPPQYHHMSAFQSFHLRTSLCLSRCRNFWISALNRFERALNWNGSLREWFFLCFASHVWVLSGRRQQISATHTHTHSWQMKSQRNRLTFFRHQFLRCCQKILSVFSVHGESGGGWRVNDSVYFLCFQLKHVRRENGEPSTTTLRDLMNYWRDGKGDEPGQGFLSSE
jgi:hypothetical protein